MITRHLIINVLLSATIIIIGTLWVYNKEVNFIIKSIIFFINFLILCFFVFYFY